MENGPMQRFARNPPIPKGPFIARLYAESPGDLNIDLSLAHQSAIQLMRIEASCR